MREGVGTRGYLLWPEVIGDQEGGLKDPSPDDLNLDAVGERRGRRR